MSHVHKFNPHFAGTAELVDFNSDGQPIWRVKTRDARPLTNDKVYADTCDADWLEQAVDELLETGFIDIYHWQPALRGGRRWVQVSLRDFRHDREPAARVIRRVMRERGVTLRARRAR